MTGSKTAVTSEGLRLQNNSHLGAIKRVAKTTNEVLSYYTYFPIF